MKYLKSWIKRELHPIETVESRSTDSYYYDVDGVKIRLSDHYGHYATCDILIVVASDLKFGKHYIIQDTQYPQLMTAGSVAEVKQIVSVLLLVKRGMVGKQRMNAKNKEVVERIIKKMNLGQITTQVDMCEFGKHAHLVCPGYSMMSNHYRSLVRELYRRGMPSSTLHNMIVEVVPEKDDESYTVQEIDCISKKISSIHGDIRKRVAKESMEITPVVILQPSGNNEIPSNVIPAIPSVTQKYNEELEIVRRQYKGANSIKKMSLAQACQFWTHVNSGMIMLFGSKWKNLVKMQRRKIYSLLKDHNMSLDDMIEFVKTTSKFGTPTEIEQKVDDFVSLKKVS